MSKLNCQFVEHGYFPIKRSDHFWVGLCPDLVIEQVMIRSIKGQGGLTRGEVLVKVHDFNGSIQLTNEPLFMRQ